MEFTFNPSSLTVPTGQQITLDLKNNGAVTHDFIIMNQGADVGTDFGEEDAPNVYWKVEQTPGTSGTYTFTVPSRASTRWSAASPDTTRPGWWPN